MNILVLGAGPNVPDGRDKDYPVWLLSVGDNILLERIVSACSGIPGAELIFCVRETDVRRYHIDNVVELVAPGSRVIQVSADTGGAACTALLAIDRIDGDDELLILNANEFLDEDYGAILTAFRGRALDAGVAVFPSVHPRYSYVRVDTDGYVTQAAEKNPISREATAGFYWYKRGADFVRACQNMIRKDAHVDFVYYICPAFNELILAQKRIGVCRVPAAHYYPAKSTRQMDLIRQDYGSDPGHR